jgi:hypothetical protein
MSLCQAIYTTTCTDAMTSEKAVLISEKSVEVCRELGLTGRVFANDSSALAITEGPCEVVHGYCDAVEADELVQTFLLQTEREIGVREFDDYSVWLNIDAAFRQTDYVKALRPDTLKSALPAQASARLRFVTKAYLDRDMIAG